ncbi:hypothetical protein BFW86_25000 [Pseudomonas fluorescens]|nr:hypothetical protein BFW86_25000 [Pseudomonas fluorescens]
MGCRGERACPALGCEAAPISSPPCVRSNRGAGFRAASQPSAGQARSPQGGFSAFKNCVDTDAPIAECQSADVPADTLQSGASPLPHRLCGAYRGCTQPKA